MRLTPWPQSLFGRLIAATVLGVLLAQAVTLYLLARNAQRIYVHATTRMWAARITGLTLWLDRLPPSRRAEVLKTLRSRHMTFGPPGPAGFDGGARVRAMWLRAAMDFRGCAPAAGRYAARSPGLRGQRWVLRKWFPRRMLPARGLRRPDEASPACPRPASGRAHAGPAQPVARGVPPGESLELPRKSPGHVLLASRPAAHLRLQRVIGRRIEFSPLGFRPVPHRFLLSRLPLHVRVRLPFRTDEDGLLAKRLRADLGKGFRVEVRPAVAAAGVIQIPSPLFRSAAGPRRFYDVAVRSAAHAPLVFRVVRLSPEIPLPPSLILNLALLVVVLVAALYVATRGITRPLSRLASAAEAVGQGDRAVPLEEKGARELRHAAHAFNTMQDRLHRYLDSRTRVLAAMSHDLKTPLTRLRLQVETLIEDAALRARLGRELDEMEGMVHGALALFRNLNERESSESLDVNALIESVREGFAAMGEEVTVAGRALTPFFGRPKALKSCLTNLVANAVKFGRRADIAVEDGAEALRICVRDRGPGIPADEIERVCEPFYRLESSRNRDTGGSGLGLSIARDVAQAHGGKLVLRNRPGGGLEVELSLPRR